MAVEVETLGWVGLGFSHNGDMVDSDIMMAWVIDGEVSISDRFAVSTSLPVVDSQQDFELVDGYEEDGKTVIQFCRLVNKFINKIQIIHNYRVRNILINICCSLRLKCKQIQNCPRNVVSTVLLG